ncbi:MAG: hypothetical protein ABII09_04635 [Planctomycetota bacterium]
MERHSLSSMDAPNTISGFLHLIPQRWKPATGAGHLNLAIVIGDGFAKLPGAMYRLLAAPSVSVNIEDIEPLLNNRMSQTVARLLTFCVVRDAYCDKKTQGAIRNEPMSKNAVREFNQSFLRASSCRRLQGRIGPFCLKNQSSLRPN